MRTIICSYFQSHNQTSKTMYVQNISLRKEERGEHACAEIIWHNFKVTLPIGFTPLAEHVCNILDSQWRVQGRQLLRPRPLRLPLHSPACCQSGPLTLPNEPSHPQDHQSAGRARRREHEGKEAVWERMTLGGGKRRLIQFHCLVHLQRKK